MQFTVQTADFNSVTLVLFQIAYWRQKNAKREPCRFSLMLKWYQLICSSVAPRHVSASGMCNYDSCTCWWVVLEKKSKRREFSDVEFSCICYRNFLNLALLHWEFMSRVWGYTKMPCLKVCISATTRLYLSVLFVEMPRCILLILFLSTLKLATGSAFSVKKEEK